MTIRRASVLVCLLALVSASSTTPRAEITQAARLEKDYPVQPVPFTSVHLNDVFWAPKIETNRTATIPAAFEQCELSGRVDNFIRAATALRGEPLANTKPPGYPFDDTDLYKVIEGASYALAVHPDPKLDAYVDSLIAKIAAAQEKDGYLYTTRTINPAAPHPWAGKERWELEKVDSHELYDMGHLFEAATAHYWATGKRTFLDVAVRAADLLVATFGPGKRAIWPGHEITEMGLVRMYRATDNVQYLTLAKFLIDSRKPDAPASSNHPATYNQSFEPVIEQTEAVGHAVRATYLYSGVADVAALTGDPAYLKAVDAIWSDVVTKKLYITGGIGASGAGEAFGGPYVLPNMTAYCETCAAVGNDFWNERMFLLHADAKYVDVMERTLYNGLISGVSLDGKTFFYPNPLESKGQHARQAWFGVACCPGNITRFIASVPGYVYAKQGQAIFVNLFAGGSADIELDGGRKVKLTQVTRYPWDGAVKMTVAPAARGQFTINVRIPGWARNEPVPGDLYRYLDPAGAAPTIKVNGQPVALTVVKGYVSINRTWQAGDVIDLNLPMPVRRIVANDQVAADRGRVAIQRGPIVYAAEWPDNPDGHVRNLVVEDATPLTTEFQPALLGGVNVVRGTSTSLSYDAVGKVVAKKRAVHGDSLLRVGQSRPGRDDDLDAAHGGRRDAAAVPDAGDEQHGLGLAQEPSERDDDQRRRGADAVVCRRIVVRLVADEGHDRVAAVRPPAGDGGVRGPGLLVRRHRPRGGAGTRVVARALQGRQRLEARPGLGCLRRRDQQVQRRRVCTGDHHCTPAGGDHAENVVGRRAGMEGQVGAAA